jgi:photosystem II stability/assembly factor-like uncharacterized protein
VFVAVGTTDGGHLFSSDAARKKWHKSATFLKGESVNGFAYNKASGTLLAATHTEGVFRSDDLGRTWKPSSRGLNVKKAWTLEVDPRRPARTYVGTQYGHLFQSDDGGKNWSEVVGLHSAPDRNNWGVDWVNGTTGLCIHTVKVDPKNSDRIFIVVSGNGTYRTDDRGKTWKRIKRGTQEACPVGTWPEPPDLTLEKSAKALQDHLRDVHGCTHKIALSASQPGVMFQQNHCGVFESSDGGENWSDISPSDRERHGFATVLTENGSSLLFTIPAYGGLCKKHLSCIRGQLAVYRRDGKAWQKLTKGLPKEAHTCVLRDAMANDTLDEPGVYFGTITGEVFGTIDSGESWFPMMKGAGRVQGVDAFTL